MARYLTTVPGAATEAAAWELVKAAARGGLADALRRGEISPLDIRMGQALLRGPGAVATYPWRTRDMLLSLLDEADRMLRAHPSWQKPSGMSGIESGNLGNIFSAIWSGVKTVGSTLVKGAGTIFKAGQTVQATAPVLEQRAQEIAADVSSTVANVKQVSDSVNTQMTVAQVGQAAGDFFGSTTGKLVMAGGAALVLVLVLTSTGRRGRR